MNDRKIALARTCLDAAENGDMTFPQIVGTLMQNGFESYAVDFRRAVAVYYDTEGDSVELPTHRVDAPVSATFDEAGISTAIREAQQLVPGYTYKGFCRKVAGAGCAGYVVSFPGRRAVYLGRTGETHVEHFPN
ncbi:MAG: DUF1398 family protein [Rhizobiaceae bacterium]|nr:DUF1398 family protein [Rhizobiaceae bacterium]